MEKGEPKAGGVGEAGVGASAASSRPREGEDAGVVRGRGAGRKGGEGWGWGGAEGAAARWERLGRRRWGMEPGIGGWVSCQVLGFGAQQRRGVKMGRVQISRDQA